MLRRAVRSVSQKAKLCHNRTIGYERLCTGPGSKTMFSTLSEGIMATTVVAKPASLVGARSLPVSTTSMANFSIFGFTRPNQDVEQKATNSKVIAGNATSARDPAEKRIYSWIDEEAEVLIAKVIHPVSTSDSESRGFPEQQSPIA